MNTKLLKQSFHINIMDLYQKVLPRFVANQTHEPQSNKPLVTLIFWLLVTTSKLSYIQKEK